MLVTLLALVAVLIHSTKAGRVQMTQDAYNAIVDEKNAFIYERNA